MELYDVGSTDQAKAMAPHVDTTTNPNITTTLSHPAVGTFVQHPSLGRQLILQPGLLQMDEGALAFAKHEMLKPRERQQVSLGIGHHRPFGGGRHQVSLTVMPSGTRPASTVTS